MRELDAATLAIVRVQATSAGMTVPEYLERLIKGQPVTSPSTAEPEGREGSGAIRAINRFQSCIDSAEVLLSSAFVEAAVKDFKPPAKRRRPRSDFGQLKWYRDVVETCLHRSRVVRNALVHDWHPTPRAERLAGDAFRLLTDLTPSRHELLQLYQYDRPKALATLAEYLDVLTREIELSANLVADVEGDDGAQATEGQRFEALRNDLLAKAGGALSLSEAADLLGMTRQGVHKRIKARSVLGMMHGNQLVIPRAQFVQRGDGHGVLEGLDGVLQAFDVAGEWSALQFLLDPDPNLGRTPLQALLDGRADDVVAAAKAYLAAED
jgi:hypothetical protein